MVRIMINKEDLKIKINDVIKKYPSKKELYKFISTKYVDPAKEKFLSGCIKMMTLNEGRICDTCGSSVFCPGHVDKSERNFWGTGNHKKDVMFILQNPGKGKKGSYGVSNTRLACTGKGSILRLVADLADLDFDEDIYTTNAVKCCTENNRVNSKNLQNCSSFLRKEIESVVPKKIVVFGEKAHESLSEISINKKLTEVLVVDHYHYAVGLEHRMIKQHNEDMNQWIFKIAFFIS